MLGAFSRQEIQWPRPHFVDLFGLCCCREAKPMHLVLKLDHFHRLSTPPFSFAAATDRYIWDRTPDCSMALYRAELKHGVAWITGASTGIGRALACVGSATAIRSLLRPATRTVFSRWSRKRRRIAGQIISFPCDVTDDNAMVKDRCGLRRGRAAHISRVQRRQLFSDARRAPRRAQYRQDLRDQSVRRDYGLVPVVERMRDRGRGHRGGRLGAAISAGLQRPPTARPRPRSTTWRKR